MPIPDQHPDTQPPAPGVRRSSPTTAPGAGSRTSGVLALSPNHRFVCAHHPDNWDLETEGMDGPTWLPDIQEIPVQPGVGGARTVKQGEDDSAAYSILIANLKSNGYHVIMDGRHFDVPAGELMSDYLIGYPCKSPSNGQRGTFWASVWDKPRHKRAGKRQKFQRDRASWNRWRLSLVESGAIPSPHPDIVDEKRARIVTHIDRHTAETRTDDKVKGAKIASLTERLADLDAANIPASGDSEVKRALTKLLKSQLMELAGGEGPLTKGRTKAQLIDMLDAAGITLAEVESAGGA